MNRPTREQQRARNAAEQVRAMVARPPKARDRYNTLVHKLPILVRTNGLLQTVAFFESKSHGDAPETRATKQLLDDIRLSLQAASFPVTRNSLSTDLAVLAYDDYIRWQDEVLRCALWLRRFSAAEFGDSTEGRAVTTTASQEGD